MGFRFNKIMRDRPQAESPACFSEYRILPPEEEQALRRRILEQLVTEMEKQLRRRQRMRMQPD